MVDENNNPLTETLRYTTRPLTLPNFTNQDNASIDLNAIKLVSSLGEVYENVDNLITFNAVSGRLELNIDNNIKIMNSMVYGSDINGPYTPPPIYSLQYGSETVDFILEDKYVYWNYSMDLDLATQTSINYKLPTDLNTNGGNYHIEKAWVDFTENNNSMDNVNKVYGVSIENNEIVVKPTAFTSLIFDDTGSTTLNINYIADDTSVNDDDFISQISVTIHDDTIADPTINNPSDIISIQEGDNINIDALLNAVAVDGSPERALVVSDSFVNSSQGINFNAVSKNGNELVFDSSKLGDVAAGESLYATLFYSVLDAAGGKAVGSYTFEVIGV